jgi:hypothetical protein
MRVETFLTQREVCFLQRGILVRTTKYLLTTASFSLVANYAWAFRPDGDGHLGITSDALSRLGFSEAAINEVNDSNRNTDVFAFHVEEAHFDNESLDTGSARLIDLKEQIIQALLSSPPDGRLARELLGGALHTLQDFYAHSNWVELGMATPEASLGRELLTPLLAEIATCPASPNVLDPSLVETTTGYYLLPNPCDAPPGRCLHGVQFFCAGINKDAPGRAGYPEAYDLAVLATEDYVRQIFDDPRMAGNVAAIAAFTGEAASSELILSIQSGIEPNDPRTFKVPVDSTVSRLEIVADLLGAPFTLVRRPSGAAISAGDRDVTVVAGLNSYRAVIDDPEDGFWRVELAGSGRFKLSATALSPLALDRFDFVDVGGTPGHEGFIALLTVPPKHSNALALARVAGSPAAAAFALIDSKGKMIDTVSLAFDPRAGTGEQVGTVFVPNKDFRFRLSGVDAAGRSFQRVTETLFVPGK